MIRRTFLDLTRRALSGAVFATMLGVKVETWRLAVEERPVGVPVWLMEPRVASPALPPFHFVGRPRKRPTSREASDVAMLSPEQVRTAYRPPRLVYVDAKAPPGWVGPK